MIEKGRDVWGIEVKKVATVQAKDGEGLSRLASKGGHFRGGALIYCGSNALRCRWIGCGEDLKKAAIDSEITPEFIFLISTCPP